MKIGQAAQLTGLTISNIRFYKFKIFIFHLFSYHAPVSGSTFWNMSLFSCIFA